MRAGSRLLLWSLLVVLFPILSTGETIRVVSYNITASTGAPQAGLNTVLQAIGAESVQGHAQPIDLLLMQEVQQQSTTTQSVVNSLASLYGAGVYSRGTLNGNSLGSGTQGVVYNSQKLTLVQESAVGTTSSGGQPRQTLRYTFRPIGGAPEHDFYVYTSHWKANATLDDVVRRNIEAAAIRTNANALGSVPIIYTGDFNVYSSGEAAYQTMLAAGEGRAVDPINQPGNWHATSSFAGIFTQAPSNNPPPGFSGGGLDDRFDFQLVSEEVMGIASSLQYIDGTYHTFGNNGSVPVNGSINSPSSTALAGLPNRLEVLNLLTTVSDHLPVVADYTILIPEPLGLLPVLMLGWALGRRRRIRAGL